MRKKSLLFCKIEKNERGPFGDINIHKKIDQGRDSNPRPSAWQTSKNPT